MALTGKQIKNTYKDILTVNSGTDNQGIESTLKAISDGEGVETAIQLSTTTLKVPSGKTLDIAGTLVVSDASLIGDLKVGDDLTVTDLINGSSMVLTGTVQTSGVKIDSKTTSQLNGITGVDGQMQYDSDKKAIMIWVS